MVRGVLRVGGADVASVDAAREGRLLSEVVAAAKQPIMALINAEIAKAEGGAAGADADKGALGAVARGTRGGAEKTLQHMCVNAAERAARADAPDVYEDNAVDEGAEEAADAALLKLPQKRKQKHRPGEGGGGGVEGAPKPQ